MRKGPRLAGPSHALEIRMKTIKTAVSVRKDDSSLDATINPVELSSKEVVAWAIAFPRPEPVKQV
jgi:hypothetical protein